MSAVLSFSQFERDGWDDIQTARSYDANMAVVTNQSIDALLDAAGVSPSMDVLDVATGAGYVAAAAARRGAKATGIDFSATQVAMAQSRYVDAQFQWGDAEELRFGDQSFDAVVCAFGLCHLPHPERALSEAFRVLKPGGRIAFSVWDIPSRAVGLGAVYEAVQAHGSTDVGLPAGPSFFHFSDPARSVEALGKTGFVSPKVTSVAQLWLLDEPEQLYRTIAASTVRAAATLRAQSPQALAAIKEALRQTVMRYPMKDRFAVPMPAIIASAGKP